VDAYFFFQNQFAYSNFIVFSTKLSVCQLKIEEN